MKHKRDAVLSERKERVLFGMILAGLALTFLTVMGMESGEWSPIAAAFCGGVAVVLQLTAAAEVCRCTKKGVHKE